MSDTFVPLSPAEMAAWERECGWDPAWNPSIEELTEPDPPFVPASSLADLPPLDTAAMVVEARLDAVRVHLAALAVELPGAVRVLEPSELMTTLQVLQRAANLTASCDQAVIAAVDDRGLADTFGFTSTTALLIDRLRLAPGEATRRVVTARGCGPRTGFTGEPLPPDRPIVAAAQAAGDITAAHAAVIVREMKRLPHDEPAVVLSEVEQALVDLARKDHPGEVADAARAAADLFDRKDPDQRERRRHRRRTVSFHQDDDGMGSLSGTLTPELLAQLQAVLSPLSAPRPADGNGEDDRSPGQRRHDALADICARLLRSGTLPDSGGTPATVAVTIPLRDLQAHAAQASAGKASRGRVTTSLGTTMTFGELLQLACEADIIPVVLNDAGGIMTHGRVKRRATKSQRQALRARDAGCSFPGCDRPPEWCEAHHVREWLRDHGDTDIGNLTLLCSHHHRLFASWGWSVAMVDGVPWWTPPAHLDPDQTPVKNTAHDRPDLGDLPDVPDRAGD